MQQKTGLPDRCALLRDRADLLVPVRDAEHLDEVFVTPSKAIVY
jgi:hypothetical protein